MAAHTRLLGTFPIAFRFCWSILTISQCLLATSDRENLHKLQIKSTRCTTVTFKGTNADHPQWTFLVFFFIFELGSLLCGLATSSKMLIVARAVAGLGSSGLMNGSLTIIGSSVPLHKSPCQYLHFLDHRSLLTRPIALIGAMMGCTLTPFILSSHR